MSLTQKEYGNLRNLYSSVYTSSEVEITEEVTEELIDEVVDELVEELVTEGYDEEEAYSLVEEATDAYIDEAKVTFGHDTTARRASGAPVGAKRRYGMRKAGEALSGAKKAVGGAVDSAKKKAAAVKAGAQIAGSIAKDEVRRAGRKAQHSASKAADAVKSAPGKAKDKAKKGIKGFIKRQAEKVVKRMSEEVEALKASGKFSEKEIEAIMEAEVQELYKGKHGQSDKEYADSRSQGGKMVSGDSKQSGAEYTHGRRVKAANPGMQPDVGGKTKPKSQGKMDRGTRADLEYRKANLKKEEVEAEMSEAMSSYDRNRKRAAQRAAARNAARDAGKTGVVPGVGYVTPRRERETYVDSAGTTRHKSGAKMPKD